MPFVDPQTVNNPQAGQPAQAAWGDAVRDAAVYLATNKPRARVYNSLLQAITTGATGEVITFDTERYDVGACHSTVTNTSRLTVPAGEGGVYSIGGNVEWQQSSTGFRVLSILLNGTTKIASTSFVPAAANMEAHQNVNCDYTLAAADYVELHVEHSNGSDLNVVATGNLSPEFWFRWVATS